MKKPNFLVKALLLVLVFTMVFSLTACGKKTNVDAGPKRIEGLLFEKRELTDKDIDVLIWWDPKNDQEEISALYKKEYGGNVNIIQKAWGAKSATVASYVASEIPCEVTILHSYDIKEFAPLGLLEEIPLAELEKKSEYWAMDEIKSDLSYNGKIYGINYYNQFAMGFTLLCYNEKMFKKYGITTPYEHFKAGNWDFDQFRKTAKELTMDTDDDGFIDQWGYDSKISGAAMFCEQNLAKPLKFANNKYTLNIDDPRYIAGLQFYSDMFNVDKSICPTSDEYQNYVNRRVAMATLNIATYPQCFADGMTEDEVQFIMFPSGPATNGKYIGKDKGGHVIISALKGTNNMQGTLAWAECATSVWLGIAQDSPVEAMDYYLTDAQKARIKELNDAVTMYKNTDYTSEGIVGTGFTVSSNYSFEEVVMEIRKNKSVKTVLDSYKPTFQGQIDAVNKTLALNAQ